MWWQPQWHEFPGWLAFLVAAALLLVLVRAGDRRRRLNPKQIDDSVGEVGCGNCGYDVRGLPGHICPECGSDLNEVGRFTARFMRWQKAPPLLRGLAWTVGCFFVLGLVTLCYLLNYGTSHFSQVEVSETYFSSIDPETSMMGEQVLLMREELRRDWVRRMGFNAEELVDDNWKRVALYPVPEGRFAELAGLQWTGPIGLPMVPDEMAWDRPEVAPIFEMEGEVAETDEIDWAPVAAKLAAKLALDPADPATAALPAHLIMSGSEWPRGMERVDASPALSIEFNKQLWYPQVLPVRWKSSQTLVWLPLAIMGGLALLVWAVGLRSALRKRPVVNQQAFEPIV